jgi:prevent-host-death family protein
MLAWYKPISLSIIAFTMTTSTQYIDALTARTQFGKIMEQAVKGKTRFVVSRRGKPTVVILGVRDFMAHVIKKPTFLVEIQGIHVRRDSL